MSGELNSDSVTIGDILQSWFNQQEIDDTRLFADWVAALTNVNRTVINGMGGQTGSTVWPYPPFGTIIHRLTAITSTP